ncbi:MAG: MTH1187 family thiamine-binding protein [Epsilonproteobacteria bacterium]|nr:MTH1187 family thiamine-binding protein [Campylobacterota bacterium]
MSVLLEFSMFPTDLGESKSAYVSKVIDVVKNSGFTYQLTPMGTIVETENIDDALKLVGDAYKILEPHANRVYSSLKFDIRKGKANRMKTKIAAVEKHIGKVSK